MSNSFGWYDIPWYGMKVEKNDEEEKIGDDALPKDDMIAQMLLRESGEKAEEPLRGDMFSDKFYNYMDDLIMWFAISER